MAVSLQNNPDARQTKPCRRALEQESRTPGHGSSRPASP